jgi:TatD DNase family protein
MPRKFLTYVDTHRHIDNTYKRPKLDYSLLFDDFILNFPPSFADCLNVFSDSFDNSVLLIGQNHSKIFGALGMHPHNANVYNDEFNEKLIELQNHSKIILLREMGLDYHYNNSPKDVQKKVFARQIQLGFPLQKPLIFHLREADEDALQLMKSELPKDHFVYIHCCIRESDFASQVLKEWPNLFFENH